MDSVYVGGPVMRGFMGTPEWALFVYQLIARTARIKGAEALLPETAPSLERMPPEAFYHAIRERIQAAIAGIILFGAPDASASVEAAMIAYAGKPQLIVAKDLAMVPRLIRGLPNVKGVAGIGPEDELHGEISRFLDENLNGGLHHGFNQ